MKELLLIFFFSVNTLCIRARISPGNLDKPGGRGMWAVHHLPRRVFVLKNVKEILKKIQLNKTTEMSLSF